jgi:hypothetical protein
MRLRKFAVPTKPRTTARALAAAHSTASQQASGPIHPTRPAASTAAEAVSSLGMV